MDPNVVTRYRDDFERVTFELSHLYSRADKAVSYAAPTYLADHLCEPRPRRTAAEG